jgi:hypothetical protein
MTAAAYGSYYHTLPYGCASYWYGPYWQCGSAYYHQTWSGNDVVYVAVDDPAKSGQPPPVQ